GSARPCRLEPGEGLANPARELQDPPQQAGRVRDRAAGRRAGAEGGPTGRLAPAAGMSTHMIPPAVHTPDVGARAGAQASLPADGGAIPTRTALVQLEESDRVRWWLSALLILGFVGLLYWPTVWKLIGDWWDDPNYSHGFLVPFFSAFLIWRRRETMATLVP